MSVDSDFDPVSESSEEISDGGDEADTDVSPGNVMLVLYISKLLQLFTICHEPGCREPLAEGPSCSFTGFAVTVTTECTAGHIYKWESHPKIGNVFAGNLIILSAVFLTRNSYYSFIEICNTLKLKALSTRYCSNIQSAYVIPEVNLMWQQHSESILAAV